MNTIIAGIRSKFSDVSHLSTDELNKMFSVEQTTEDDNTKPSLLLLDARPLQEFSVSHMAGATRMTHDTTDEELQNYIQQNVTADGDSKTNIVCYCSLGYRSSLLARRVVTAINVLGNKDNVSVYNLEGSLFKWANENRPMVDANGADTIFVHPYNTVFGLTLRSELKKYKV